MRISGKMSQMKNERGFSMMEIMTVCTIVGVMTTMAVPGMMRSVRTYRLGSAARQVAQALQAARFDAIRTNTSSQVKFDTTNFTVQSGAGAVVALPPGVQFTSLPTGVTAPSVITAATTNATNIPGQVTDSATGVSFPTSAGLRVATFTTRGVPGNLNGTLISPGAVNWAYLINSQGEIAVVTLTGAGSTQVLRWNANTSQWIS
jgi:prepilin-type N-terminal cleavage/methylation domain-containing protein